MTTETGGPAFPCEGGNKFISGNEIRKTLPSSGMTLRDYFAAKAMQGLLAEPMWEEDSTAQVLVLTRDTVFTNPADRFASAAYKLADAMLAARTK